MFKSKRFWTAIAAIAASVGSAYAGEITWIQALQAGIGAAAALILSYGVRDPGQAK